MINLHARSVRLRSTLMAVAALGLMSSGPALAQDEAPAYSAAYLALFEPLPEGDGNLLPYPRLTGTSPAVQSINAQLEAEEAINWDLFPEEEISCTLSRYVTLPFYSADYVAFSRLLSNQCEGMPHEDHTTLDLVFDRKSGEVLDWATALPGLKLEVVPPFVPEDDPSWIGGPAQTVRYRSPILLDWFQKHFQAERAEIGPQEDDDICLETLTPEALSTDGLVLTLSAENGGVEVATVATPRCFTAYSLTPDEMSQYGAPARLVSALRSSTAEHQWSPPYDDYEGEYAEDEASDVEAN